MPSGSRAGISLELLDVSLASKSSSTRVPMSSASAGLEEDLALVFAFIWMLTLAM